MRNVRLVLAVLIVLASTLSAHDPGTHMYIGSQTFDLWQDYDSNFYNYLTRGENDYWGGFRGHNT
jgi:hypothetical protein